MNEVGQSKYDGCLTRAELLAALDADLENGRLFWRGSNKYRAQQRAGQEAGGISGTPQGGLYWTVRINGRLYRRAAIMFCIVNGRYPNVLADHINGNSLDDRPLNLREATHMQNMWNRKQRRIQTLPMGVRLIPKSGRYQARIVCNKKMHHLGAYDTPEEARQIYLQKRQAMFGEFA